MFETAYYESERRVTGAVVVAIAVAAYAGLHIAIAPNLLTSVDSAQFAEEFGPQVVEMLGLGVIGSLEGFLAAQLYHVGWVLMIGIYVAYSGAGAITGDIETDRMDTLLAAPISREQVVVENFLSLCLPIVVVNVTVGIVVYGGSLLIGTPIAVGDLIAVHVLSIPYLLCCGAIGILCSVLTQHRSVAEGASVGFLVVAFVVEVVTAYTSLAWLGALTPMRYYDPVAILAESTYDLAGAGLLFVTAIGLLLVSQAWFKRVDIQ